MHRARNGLILALLLLPVAAEANGYLLLQGLLKIEVTSEKERVCSQTSFSRRYVCEKGFAQLAEKIDTIEQFITYQEQARNEGSDQLVASLDYTINIALYEAYRELRALSSYYQ
jgi:hypothetical protein